MSRGGSALLLVAVGLIGACGSDTIDPDEVEQQIENQVSTATADVASVACPSDVEKEEGARFECDVELKGGGRAVVTVTQGSGNELTYRVKEGTMRLADDTLEPYFEAQLARQGVSAQVDCPDLVKVKAGKTATCDVATAGDRQTTLTFTWEDAAGSVDPMSVKTEP